MDLKDVFVTAITAWRENRGGGKPGMQSVINVIFNRAAKRKTSPYIECVKPWQFSSMTATGDPELSLWPVSDDPQFAMALEMAQQAIAGALEDITGGATFYYALSIKNPPKWAATMKKTAEIAGQVFFREV